MCSNQSTITSSTCDAIVNEIRTVFHWKWFVFTLFRFLCSLCYVPFFRCFAMLWGFIDKKKKIFDSSIFTGAKAIHSLWKYIHYNAHRNNERDNTIHTQNALGALDTRLLLFPQVPTVLSTRKWLAQSPSMNCMNVWNEQQIGKLRKHKAFWGKQQLKAE